MTSTKSLHDVLKGYDVTYGLVGNVWPSVTHCAKPMKERNYGDWNDLFIRAGSAFASVKKNGHKVVIKLSLSEDGYRRVRVYYPGSGEDLTAFADIIDIAKIDIEFFRLGVEVIAEATASVWVRDFNGNIIKAAVGYEGISTALRKRAPPADPRVILHLHMFSLYKIGHVYGMNITRVYKQWKIIDTVFKGQEHVSLAPMLKMDIVPFSSDVRIYNPVASIDVTCPLSKVRETLCGIATDWCEEGFVLYLDPMAIKDRMQGKGNMKPYFKEQKSQRLWTMVKCKPPITIAAELSIKEYCHPRDEAKYVAKCLDENCVQKICCAVPNYLAQVLFDKGLNNVIVRLRVSWVSGSGGISGVHMIREEDILAGRSSPEATRVVISNHAHLRLCHHALENMESLSRYQPGVTDVSPPKPILVSKRTSDDDDKEAYARFRPPSLKAPWVWTPAPDDKDDSASGLGDGSPESYYKVGSPVTPEESDVEDAREKIIVNTSPVHLKRYCGKAWVCGEPLEKEESGKPPIYPRTTKIAEKEETVGSLLPDVSDDDDEGGEEAPKSPEKEEAGGPLPPDVSDGDSLDDIDDDFESVDGEPGPCTQDMGDNSLDDTRTPVGSPGPCTQDMGDDTSDDPNNNSEISSLYY